MTIFLTIAVITMFLFCAGSIILNTRDQNKFLRYHKANTGIKDIDHLFEAKKLIK